MNMTAIQSPLAEDFARVGFTRTLPAIHLVVVF